MTPEPARTRLLLADDHATVREGLAMLINGQADMTVVAEADDGRQAVELAERFLPDVVILDVSMPVMNGIVAAVEIRQVAPAAAIIALTRHGDYRYIDQLLRSGVNGYVLKQSASSELLQAIRAVSQGKVYFDPLVAKELAAHRVSTKPRPDAAQTLSPRETAVLRLLARGYANRDVAAELNISVKTVEAHKANAMGKLALRSRIEIVRYALLRGWLQDT